LPFIESVTTETSKVMSTYHNITVTRILCCQCQRGNPKG